MVVGILIVIIILGVVGFIQYTLIQKASKNRVESLEKEASQTHAEA